MNPVHVENVKPICNIRLCNIIIKILIKILASILQMVHTNIFYFVLKHCIAGLGVDFDYLFIQCRSLIDFKECE